MNFKLKGNTTVISSLRHSGKSELCRMLMLSQQEDFDHVFVVSCTNKCNIFYDWVNPNNILTEFLLIFNKEIISLIPFSLLATMKCGCSVLAGSNTKRTSNLDFDTSIPTVIKYFFINLI